MKNKLTGGIVATLLAGGMILGSAVPAQAAWYDWTPRKAICSTWSFFCR